MATISAVIVESALEIVGEDIVTYNVIVFMQDETVWIKPESDDPNLTIRFERDEWNAVKKLVDEEYRRIDSEYVHPRDK